ncbi:thioredoxin family protein [[Limnothrix rosea] IAM M-220]|uniref:thioredoxin family protein n=1 Tax=[Limnothrix rosea] IAM M-220 TaxID=454133 RepID=UPI000961FC30|nr:thioredoxin domain-containing protein [[Limnothrix rosea] IAM M-220]OKH18754.1 thiol reductase thioredoxin [[Limnothrix rosea] IAM M-220]
MGKAEFIKDEMELEVLLGSASVLVVDCMAMWCEPCQLVAPLIDQLAEKYGDRATILKLNVDENPFVGPRFGVKSIPTVLFFKDGELQTAITGVKPYETFSSTLESF